MGPSMPVRNIPENFERFIAAPPHRLFAIFDDSSVGEEMIDWLRTEECLTDEDDIWVLYGKEGLHRLDLGGSGHGVHGVVIRLLQRFLSSDVDYIETLDEALRSGKMVIAVMVDPDNIDRVIEMLQMSGGHTLAKVAHWDFVPVVH